MQTIYRKYKDRFIEISGKNRSLFTKSIVKKYSFDLGAILQYFDAEVFYNFLWCKKDSYTIVNEKICKKLAKQQVIDAKKQVMPLVFDSDQSLIDGYNNFDDSHNLLLKKTIHDLKYLKREVEEIQKETGKYDLYIGFPYIFGKIGSDLSIKAPLLLFPVSVHIQKDLVTVQKIPNQPITLNKNFIVAYCKQYNINSDNIIQEFDNLSDQDFDTIYDIVDYLNQFGCKIKYQKRKGILPFDSTKNVDNHNLELKNMAVLGRFPLANSIYNDYLLLEKKNLSTPSIDLLLQGKEKHQKNKNKHNICYTINDLDFAQENAINKINTVNNIVIYGPPGTGKSQTIVNIISDALCKNKKVLVVSQKQAALDVVFSRLGLLSNKAMLIPDPEKDKSSFFDRIKQMHTKLISDNKNSYSDMDSMGDDIDKELDILSQINDTLFSKTEFGLSLQQMYAQSFNIGKDTKDYLLYSKLKNTDLILKNYDILQESIQYIHDKNIAQLYFDKQKLIENNAMIAHLKADLDIHKLKKAHAFINKIIAENRPPFNFAKYPNSRYLITFYLEKAELNRISLHKIADIVTKTEHPELAYLLKISSLPLFLPLYPLVKYRYNKHRKDINIDLNVALNAISDTENEFSFLSNIISENGYALVLGGILNGNYEFLKKILSAFDNYVYMQDIDKVLLTLGGEIQTILQFCYKNSDKSIDNFVATIDKVMPLRIYHEITRLHKYVKQPLSYTVNFDSIRQRILSVKNSQKESNKQRAIKTFDRQYCQYFGTSYTQKDFLYQINKQRSLWSIRRMVEYFEDYLFKLFPCWLLSPQTASTILPLSQGMFDIVIFDEASQMFVENALPTIYRGKSIVVAGDSKQLPPSTGFVKRYQADDSFDYNMDLSTQTALEVQSLLDLATAKYTHVHLSYHYRSDYEQLINFSNVAFYNNKLQIAPNITLSDNRPIERIKVDGKWYNRHNHIEAEAVVNLVKDIFKNRKNNQTIGIITFNNEQKEYIEDMLEIVAEKNASFRKQLFIEQNRIENGENRSLFVKNLENVQGDERDIIIFSIGYAKNDNNKITSHFGSLSAFGGENRLNVAITRAKSKIYIVTSIEPEDIDKLDNSKCTGVKLLKKYLQYARAVSENNSQEINNILHSFCPPNNNTPKTYGYELQIKKGLEGMGYTVYSQLGNTDYKISLGVYDKDYKRFILGIECDYQAYSSGQSVLERDVYHIKFLESKQWKIVRVWAKDWWQSNKLVLEHLSAQIEQQKSLLHQAI